MKLNPTQAAIERVREIIALPNPGEPEQLLQRLAAACNGQRPFLFMDAHKAEIELLLKSMTQRAIERALGFSKSAIYSWRLRHAKPLSISPPSGVQQADQNIIYWQGFSQALLKVIKLFLEGGPDASAS